MSTAPDRIYLDDHATTPCDPRVVEAMAPWWQERCGNPSSPHLFGWEAHEAVEAARAELAATVGAQAREVVFTAGATESNNLALLGVALRAPEGRRHAVTSTIEHPAVLEPLEQLERQGWEVTRVGVDRSGVVDPGEFVAALREDTALASLMWANNEIGTVQPVADVGAACRERGIAFHCDATQAIGRLPVDMAAAQVDLLSLSAHKFYGPKGVGALVASRRRPRVRLSPLQYGGGQQDGLRPGTIPVPLVVGLGEAARLAREELPEEAAKAARLRERLLAALVEGLGDVYLNGDAQRRLPGNLNVVVPGVEAQALLLELPGLAFSAGSACHAAENEPSAVLLAIGRSATEAHCSIRLGLGRFHDEAQVDAAAQRIVAAAGKLRQGPVHEAVAARTSRTEDQR